MWVGTVSVRNQQLATPLHGLETLDKQSYTSRENKLGKQADKAFSDKDKSQLEKQC